MGQMRQIVTPWCIFFFLWRELLNSFYLHLPTCADKESPLYIIEHYISSLTILYSVTAISSAWHECLKDHWSSTGSSMLCNGWDADIIFQKCACILQHGIKKVSTNIRTRYSPWCSWLFTQPTLFISFAYHARCENHGQRAMCIW